MSFSNNEPTQKQHPMTSLLQQTTYSTTNIVLDSDGSESNIENPSKSENDELHESSISKVVINENAPQASFTRNNQLIQYSCWDLIISRINEQIAHDGESGVITMETASLKRLEKLLCEIEEILSRFQSVLFNCCSVSFYSKTPQHDRSYMFDNKSVYPGEHLSKYLEFAHAKNEVFKNDIEHCLKIEIRDNEKIHDEYFKTTIQPLQFCTIASEKNNDLDEAKFVEEVLYRMDRQSKEISPSLHDLKPDSDNVRRAIVSENVENTATFNPNFKQIKRCNSIKCSNKKKSRKKLKKETEQQCMGPPPPPIIREDGKKIYRKQKVISGYFSHYPISEEDYNKVIDSGEPFTCPPCQKQFKHRRSWEHHLNGRCLGMPLTKPNWYKQDGKFFCAHEGCTETASNRGWTTSYMVWVHFYRVHSPGGQLPHKCDLCDKSFAKIAQLRIHKECKHNVNRKTYTCDSCGKVFAYQRSLREHERRHKGQKPFACDECTYRAVSLSQIHAHKKLHHQDPPESVHVCDICGKGFKRKSNLQEHIPTHSDVREFLCTICGRYLKTDNSYRRHMVCVHGVKYTCCVCKKDFSSQLGVQIHQRDKHGLTT